VPARKNRLGKHGVAFQTQLDDTSRLVDKLVKCERETPGHDHYVSWFDMANAKQLVKHGHLREGGRATGCFVVTEKFRQTFMPS
jgi:hypothetical protein